MTIFRKSLLTLGLAVFILVSVLVVSVLAFMNFLYYETNARFLSSTTAALFSVFSEEELLRYFAGGNKGTAFPYTGEQYRLTLIDINGDVLWDSLVEERMVNHLDREEVRRALEGREGRALRNSLSIGKRSLYTALPVKNADGAVAGVFRLSAEVPSFWLRITPAALYFLLLAAILASAAFLGVFGFSRSLSFSLDRLVDIALETGDFRYTDTSLGEPEEIMTLEKALRSMSTELKLSLKEAKTESRRIEAILNSMSEAVIAMDNNLMLLLFNPCAGKLFAIENFSNRIPFPRLAALEQPDKIPLRSLSLLEATRSTELEWAARKVLKSGEPEKMELSFFFGGMERRYQISVTAFSSDTPLASDTLPESGAAGKESRRGIVMVMEDQTRITRLEQIRKDFVANVSHELRTPIQLMKGFSETLLDSPSFFAGSEDSDEKKQLRHFIEIIRKNSYSMENLINDLLSLASLEDQNEGRQNKEELVLAPLFTEAVSMVEIEAAKKQTTIRTDCPPEIKANLYGSFILQALVNLLDNAIKYSPDASEVFARAYSEGEKIVLEVKDSGIGIPAEHLERIFERFYRVEKARSRDAGGTGLGLAIVRHIALLHGGSVEVESHAGEGSVFRLLIPKE